MGALARSQAASAIVPGAEVSPALGAGRRAAWGGARTKQKKTRKEAIQRSPRRRPTVSGLPDAVVGSEATGAGAARGAARGRVGQPRQCPRGLRSRRPGPGVVRKGPRGLAGPRTGFVSGGGAAARRRGGGGAEPGGRWKASPPPIARSRPRPRAARGLRGAGARVCVRWGPGPGDADAGRPEAGRRREAARGLRA